jgi:alkaline phosphatase D
MDGTGRRFQGLSGWLLLLLLAWAGGAAASEAPGLLVTVGEVTSSSAVVWVRGSGPGNIRITYGAEGTPPVTRVVPLDASADFTAKIPLGPLTPATRYRYRLIQGRTVEGEFLTAPPAGEMKPVSFLWSGDLGSRNRCRHLKEGYPIFQAMARLRPDFFLFVGDTIYADHRCAGPDRVPGYDFAAKTLNEYRAKHRYNRSDPAVQAFFRATSVYAIWDDHEVRNDFAGSIDPLMPLGRRAFLDYWPILPPAEEAGRLYRKVRWGKLVELFILDTRQYRSPNAETDGPSKTMLGPAQRRWLVEGVAGSAAAWKVVVSSVSLSIPTGRDARDSWTNANLLGIPEPGAGFAAERTAILKAFHERKVKNLLWVVADVHHAELIRHAPWPGFAFHELVAGPLSAVPGRPRPLDQGLQPSSLFAHGGEETFGSVAVDPTGLTVTFYDRSGQALFSRKLPAESLDVSLPFP